MPRVPNHPNRFFYLLMCRFCDLQHAALCNTRPPPAQELAEAVANAPYCLPAWVLLAALQFRLGWLDRASTSTTRSRASFFWKTQKYQDC